MIATPLRIAGAALVALTLGACARPGETAPVRRDPLTASDSVKPLPYTGLALGMLREVVARAPDSNAFISPLSAGMALSLVYNGASGNTQREMGALLETGALTLGEVNAANRSLRAALRSDDVELSVANALWAARGGPLTAEYTERVRRAYDAEIARVDFTDPATPARINGWVSDATRGRIPTLVSAPMDPSLVLFVANAVYFKGRWADEFRKAATRDLPFLLPDGTRAPRPTMHRTGSYGYLDGDGFRAVRLPYRGDRLAMYVLLPDSGSSLAALRERLTRERWDAWMTGFARRDVSVALPRFRAEGTYPLVEPLRALGMRDAFDSRRASFRAMLPASYFEGGRNVYVSEGTQKTWIEVNEEGTEAAAATGFGISVTSAPPPPVPFVVDRPFLAAVRDDRTGAILFIGQVTDPG
jgi:serpin B